MTPRTDVETRYDVLVGAAPATAPDRKPAAPGWDRWRATVSWSHVLPLAVVLAFANGFWIVSLRGSGRSHRALVRAVLDLAARVVAARAGVRRRRAGRVHARAALVRTAAPRAASQRGDDRPGGRLRHGCRRRAPDGERMVRLRAPAGRPAPHGLDAHDVRHDLHDRTRAGHAEHGAQGRPRRAGDDGRDRSAAGGARGGLPRWRDPAGRTRRSPRARARSRVRGWCWRPAWPAPA